MQTNSTPPNPYFGPRTLRMNEQLFGREKESLDLFYEFMVDRIVLFHSVSGAGKSSLVNTRLIHMLKNKGFLVLPPIRVNLEPQIEFLKRPSFNRFIYSACLSLSEGLPYEQRLPESELANLSLEDFLQHLLAAPSYRGDGASARPVLIFDQFEELLTTNPFGQADRSDFLEQVGTCLGEPSRWALFVMREDYIAALEPYARSFPTGFRNRFRIDMLGPQAALEAVIQPARLVGVDFTELAARKLVDDLRSVRFQQPDGSLAEVAGPYIEPVQLQIVCYNLWTTLSPGKTIIDIEDLARLGNIEDFLGRYYEDAVKAAAVSCDLDEQQIREWVDRNLIINGVRGQVFMGPGETAGLNNQALRQLENAHILRSERRAGTIWLEITHDRLLTPIQANNARWFEANRTLLQRQAGLWSQMGRPYELLLSGRAFSEALTWANLHENRLTVIDRDFLQACQAAISTERSKTGSQRVLRLVIILQAFIIIALVIWVFLLSGR